MIKKTHVSAAASVVALIALGACLPLTGQEVKKVGTSSAAFLRIPVGAKAVAMGSAFTAVADDGSAVFWNPGNVARQPKRSLFVDHSPWLPGLDYSFIGFSLPLTRLGVLGVCVTSLRSEEMDITTLEAPMGTGETFTAASTAASVTFAGRLTDRFSIGANVKYINERIYDTSASGFAFDIGTLFVTPFRNVRLGVSVSNMGTQMQMRGEDLNSTVDVAPNQEGNNDNIVAQLKTDRFDLPIVMRIGISWDWRLPAGSRMTVAVDGVNPNDNSQSLNAGVEFETLNRILLLRAGVEELFLEDREKGLTLGAGLRVPAGSSVNLTLGYAYQEFHYLRSVNHFSIEIGF